MGIHSTLHTLPENVVEADVKTIVEQLSNDISVDGILVRGCGRASNDVFVLGILDIRMRSLADMPTCRKQHTPSLRLQILHVQVQLPLPAGLREEVILEKISPVKDVDGKTAADPTRECALWSCC